MEEHLEECADFDAFMDCLEGRWRRRWRGSTPSSTTPPRAPRRCTPCFPSRPVSIGRDISKCAKYNNFGLHGPGIATAGRLAGRDQEGRLRRRQRPAARADRRGGAQLRGVGGSPPHPAVRRAQDGQRRRPRRRDRRAAGRHVRPRALPLPQRVRRPLPPRDRLRHVLHVDVRGHGGLPRRGGCGGSRCPPTILPASTSG